jgi:molybdenum cofactor cytidylyltransferase
MLYFGSMRYKTGISLTQALRVERGAVVSFVGGGGKTTSMFRLAAELCSAGFRVISTTTTHISKEQVHLAPASVLTCDLDSLTARLDEHGHCLIVETPDEKGRVYGASLQLITDLSACPDIDVILIEADGSRSLPFKAPGKHEPVVHEMTTILVPIVGLNSLGQPLDEAHVHRSEIAAELAQAPLGSPVTSETIARVLSHPEGGAKLLPAGARLVPLLNKADTEKIAWQGSELAAKLLERPIVDSVAVSCLLQEPPVLEAWTSAAGIVLAANQAEGYRVANQALPWIDTTPVVCSAQAALEAGLDPVMVVAGPESQKMGKALAGLPVILVVDPEFPEGWPRSLRKALEVLPSRTGAALTIFADRPFVTTAMIQTIVQTHRRTLAPICVPAFEGRQGSPALFDKALFRELTELSGDNGVCALFEKYSNAIVSAPVSGGALPDNDTLL